MAYQLDLLATFKIHPMFHVSCLKNKLGDRIYPLPSLLPIYKDGEIKPKLEPIMDRRMKKLANHCVTEVMVKWVGAPDADNMW